MMRTTSFAVVATDTLAGHHIVAARTSSSVERALWMRRLARKDDVVERGDRCDRAGEVGSTLRGLRGETCCSTPGEGANLLMRRHRQKYRMVPCTVPTARQRTASHSSTSRTRHVVSPVRLTTGPSVTTMRLEGLGLGLARVFL